MAETLPPKTKGTKMSKNITQAREALEFIVEFFAWDSDSLKSSVKNRITASLGKDIKNAHGALLGTAQSLAKVSREAKGSEADKQTIDFIAATFTGASLLAKHFEKPAPVAQAVAETPEAEAKPKARMKSPKATSKTAPEVGNALSAEQLSALTALLANMSK